MVLDRDGAVAGEGYHVEKGQAHAEVHALRAAGTSARGGTALVTLEPCNHTGRTPPCRQALLDAGVRRVVIGVLDPTSRDGGGAAALRRHGVDVEVGLLADEVLAVLRPWLRSVRRGRPFVTWARGGPGHDLVVDARLVAEPSAEGRWAASVGLVPDIAVPAEPRPALAALAAQGARTVLLLAGDRVAQAFLAEDLVDEIRWRESPPSPSWSPGAGVWRPPPGFAGAARRGAAMRCWSWPAGRPPDRVPCGARGRAGGAESEGRVRSSRGWTSARGGPRRRCGRCGRGGRAGGGARR